LAKAIDVREQAAKEAGVSHGSLSAYRYLKDNAEPEELEELMRDPNAKLHKAVKTVRERTQKASRHKKRTSAAKDFKIDDRIIVGDFRKHADRVADGSLSLIFTDPPYDREASKMLPELAEFAAAKLADGGSLVCYVGQTQLPAAMDALRIHLRYWWTIACVHAGRSTVMREYGINAGWKAVLWFVKGTRDDNGIMVSDVMSGGEEKTHHDWQQSQSEAEYWIEKLCPKEGIVCDPFLGGGTTGAAAEKVNRQWIGFELDPENAKIAAGRAAQ
jgi:16S rRNA G966 N2-methylase RsmD